jgi:hypothetical protein
MATPAEVLLDQARVQLQRQEAKIDQLRTVAGVVLTGAGVIAGFVAPNLAAVQRAWSIAATGAFIACVLLGIVILAPRRDLLFSEGLDTYLSWIEAHGDQPGAAEVFALGLAANLEQSRMDNEQRIEQIPTWLQYQCGLFGAEVVLWAVAALLR